MCLERYYCEKHAFSAVCHFIMTDMPGNPPNTKSDNLCISRGMGVVRVPALKLFGF